jgi:tetratricopeptide (TPR) repeat protein
MVLVRAPQRRVLGARWCKKGSSDSEGWVVSMTKEELLERFEALGDERDFLAARSLYEQALAGEHDARDASGYGYLLEAHARRQLRRAVELYERAIELDPDRDQPHYQLISARAGLQEPEFAIAVYERRVARSPRAVREYRFLASAYLRARAFQQACEAVETGLALEPDDAALIAMRGEARAGIGDPEGALADWRRALELEPEDIGPHYSSAFLLERQGRLAEAIEAWRSIIKWNESRGYTLQTEWPNRELERLCSTLAD